MLLLIDTLALAVKKYRTLVDSRRFVALASEAEFQNDFDVILSGILGNLSECYEFAEDSNGKGVFTVNIDNVLMAIDILKLMIIIKHFINDPVYSDEASRNLFKTVSLGNFKVVSTDPSSVDDRKAQKKFESFIVTLFTLLWQDKDLNLDAKKYFETLSVSRLQVLLLDAAPRASHEEIYHKSYRNLLIEISDVSDMVPTIINRLDIYYPEPQIIDGLTRKEFILERLGWKSNTVYGCADLLIKDFEDGIEAGNTDKAVERLRFLWVLLSECKFVAVDEFCATLFIFPSECEPFYKSLNALKSAIKKISSSAQNLSKANLEILNQINTEIATWTAKLLKALDSNYTHFERDLNNHGSQDSSKLLRQIVAAQVEISHDIFNTIEASEHAGDMTLTQPIQIIIPEDQDLAGEPIQNDTNDAISPESKEEEQHEHTKREISDSINPEVSSEHLSNQEEQIPAKGEAREVEEHVEFSMNSQYGSDHFNEKINDSEHDKDTAATVKYDHSIAGSDTEMKQSSPDEEGIREHMAIHIPSTEASQSKKVSATPYWAMALTVVTTFATFLYLREMLNPTNK
jgi:hypothetical protein